MTTFLGTYSLYVLICRKAVNQSINRRGLKSLIDGLHNRHHADTDLK